MLATQAVQLRKIKPTDLHSLKPFSSVAQEGDTLTDDKPTPEHFS